jgi:UMF1 family MFS transporter
LRSLAAAGGFLLRHRKDALAWALYDWANSAFATTVMAGFFPVFFKEYWGGGVPATVSTLRLGWANSLAGLLIALSAPILGSVADRGGMRKRFLLFFTLAGVAATAGLSLVPGGGWRGAFVLYVLATVGFAGGVMFNDALLTSVADEATLDRVSALGYALGYVGGGVLFALNVWMATRPDLFGFPSPAAAVRFSFVTVAVWWLVFSLPLFRMVREPPPSARGAAGGAVAGGIRQLADTFREARRHRNVFLFLLAYWIYIDGVDTIIRMAVDYGLSLGFRSQSLILALLITQFVGFPAALLFGRIGQRQGPRTGILIALAVYAGVTLWGYRMEREGEFYLLAVVVGLVQGGVQSLSRSLFARLIPPDKPAEFFGLYNIMGKFAVIAGPLIMGQTAALTGNPRASILALNLFFVAGGILLLRVKVERPAPPGGG